MKVAQPQIRVHPRSIGIACPDTYEKHSQKISLKSEALELARCRNMNIQTAHVKAAELIRFDDVGNRLIAKRVIGKTSSSKLKKNSVTNSVICNSPDIWQPRARYPADF